MSTNPRLADYKKYTRANSALAILKKLEITIIKWVVGRIEERKDFGKYSCIFTAELIAIYNRSRIGKTFLLRLAFENICGFG